MYHYTATTSGASQLHPSSGVLGNVSQMHSQQAMIPPSVEWGCDTNSVYNRAKRSALAPINQQVGVLQRFVIAPLKNTVKNLNNRKDKTRRNDEDDAQTAVSDNEVAVPYTDDERNPTITRFWRANSMPDMSQLRFDDGVHHRQSSSVWPSDITLSSLRENVLLLILSKLGFEQHLKVRLVCKQWYRASSKLGMDPVDEVSQIFDVMQVVEYAQDILRNMLCRENELWSASNALQMQNALSGQREVSAEMRRVLVDWLIEVHFKFRLKPQTLYTAIGLVNRVLFNIQVARRELQTIGVSSIMVAAKFEERFAPAINDLVYITSHSSSRHKIVAMEAEILKIVNYELTLPSAWSFVNRFAKILNLTKDETLMATYLVDLTLPESVFVHIRPSLIVLSSMYLLRQLQHIDPWNDKIAFYSKYSEAEVKQVAAEILQAAKQTKSTSVPKKYKTSTYGGVAPAIQELLASVSDVMAM